MRYAELVNLYFERSNALQWYWTLYVVVIGGLLAFSSLRQRPDLLTAVLVTVLYCFFAYKNLGAIRDVTMQRLAVLELIRETPAVAPTATQNDTLRMSLQVTLAGSTTFHTVVGNTPVPLGTWVNLTIPKYSMASAYDPGTAFLYVESSSGTLMAAPMPFGRRSPMRMRQSSTV